MAVNTNFYTAVNELFARATGGSVSATVVVDYDTFIDAGKALSAMSYTDLQNTLVPAIMNKVQKTLNDNPAYMGQLFSMDKGRLDYGVLEIIVNDFYSANASVWDGSTISAGNTYTGQFEVVNLPNEKAKYYTDSASWGFDVTVRDTDLKGIFESPEKFDAFIRSMFVSVANSVESAKENIRFAVIADIIKKCAAVSASATDENVENVHYNLLAIYNTEKGTSLTNADCLLSNDFVSWSVGVIRDVALLMAKPSKKFSVTGDVTTFTPESYRNLVINGVYDKAIRRSLIDAYNKEYGMINFDYEVVPYWQLGADRMRVTTNGTPSGSDPIVTTYSPYTLAVLYDKRSCGVLTQLDDVTTDRNGKYRYTNYHYQFNWLNYIMLSANTVIFTIGSAS